MTVRVHPPMRDRRSLSVSFDLTRRDHEIEAVLGWAGSGSRREHGNGSRRIGRGRRIGARRCTVHGLAPHRRLRDADRGMQIAGMQVEGMQVEGCRLRMAIDWFVAGDRGPSTEADAPGPHEGAVGAAALVATGGECRPGVLERRAMDLWWPRFGEVVSSRRTSLEGAP